LEGVEGVDQMVDSQVKLVAMVQTA